MDKTIKTIALFILIIPTSVLLFETVGINLFIIHGFFISLRGFFLFVSLVFQLIGYYALWTNIIFNNPHPKNLKSNNITLFIGLFGCLLILFELGFGKEKDILISILSLIPYIIILINNSLADGESDY